MNQEKNIIKQSEHIEYDELAEILNSQEDFSGKIVVINESAAKIGYDTNSVYIRLGIALNDIEDIAEKYSHAEKLIAKLNVKLDGAFGKVTNGLETSHNGLQAGDTLNVDSHMGHTAKFIGYDAAEDIYVIRFESATGSCAEGLYGKGAWYINKDNVTPEEKFLDEYITIDGTEYQIRNPSDDGWYLLNRDGHNAKWFVDNDIDAEEFVEEIVGYEPLDGQFPYVKTADDLKAVIKAMQEYQKPRFKVGDKVRFVDCDADDTDVHPRSLRWARDKLTPGHVYTVKKVHRNWLDVEGEELAFIADQFIKADEPIPYGTEIDLHGLEYTSSDRFLTHQGGDNGKIFELLDIDKHKFINDLGIETDEGGFPFVDRKDLPKVVDALIAYEKPTVRKGSIVMYKEKYYYVKEVDTDNTCRLDEGVGWVSNDDIKILRE